MVMNEWWWDAIAGKIGTIEFKIGTGPLLENGNFSLKKNSIFIFIKLPAALSTLRSLALFYILQLIIPL